VTSRIAAQYPAAVYPAQSFTVLTANKDLMPRLFVRHMKKEGLLFPAGIRATTCLHRILAYADASDS